MVSEYPALNFLRARHVNLTPMTRSSDDMKEGELRLGDVQVLGASATRTGLVVASQSSLSTQSRPKATIPCVKGDI